MKRRWRFLLTLATLAFGAGEAAAQRPVQQPPAPQMPRQPLTPQQQAAQADGDTLADTLRTPEVLVEWAEPDTIEAALLARAGFTATRYRGRSVTFDAATRDLILIGDAAVQREEMTIVADTIRYNDSLQIVRASSPPGDTVILRDPASNEADLVSVGGWITYDLLRRRGTGANLATASEARGETWYVQSHRATVVGDPAGVAENVFYGLHGAITSCNLTDPHYHFQAREIKRYGDRLIVARPAVLYIADIPVMWLPFLVQDTRPGRRSGFLAPRFGITDIVRTSTNYRRQIENLGYYWAASDYADGLMSVDWRSGARDQLGDPGWWRLNGEVQYRWLDRFLNGRLGVSHARYSDERTNTSVSLAHQQSFSSRSNLNASINYTTNTTVYRQQALNVLQALGTIYSSLSFQQGLGPANLSIGGSRTQYPGQERVSQNFPNLSVSTQPIAWGERLVWTPSLQISNTQNLNVPVPERELAWRFVPGPGGIRDSVEVLGNDRTTTVSFPTPVRIFGWQLNNNFTINDFESDIPRTIAIVNPADTSVVRRTFARQFSTGVDWQFGFSLPSLSPGRWNLTPSVNFVNVDPGPLAVRSYLSGGEWVTQNKRPQFSLSSTPTLFAFIPGFGPFERIRHRLNPSVSWAYSPAGVVDDDYLRAVNRSRVGYLGALRQNVLSVGFTQEFEARLRGPDADTLQGGQHQGDKIRLLALDFSPLGWDFERAAQTGRTGLTTSRFSYSAQSDLLPGFQVSVGYSLFQGDILSDTARLSPFREDISASMTFSPGQDPFSLIRRLFGGAAPAPAAGVTPPVITGSPTDPFGAARPVAGGASTRNPLVIPQVSGWQASFQFSSQRQRPPTGTNIVEFDPARQCLGVLDPVLRRQCEEVAIRQAQSDTLGTATPGGVFVRLPTQTTLRSSFSFPLTPSWALQWQTGYDFVRSEFSDHFVSLQRELHDWRTSFGFTQSPNGNFAFTFLVSLKAEPDLKFDYNRRTYRPNP